MRVAAAIFCMLTGSPVLAFFLLLWKVMDP